MDKFGLLKCASYAYAPNSLHYCGPEKQKDLLGYLTLGQIDRGLSDIINRFETLYPYLELIAHANNLKDPFDPRVVEAYWLGNNLLKNIKQQSFAEHLSESLMLKKKLPQGKLNSMLGNVVGGLPNHIYHVLAVYKRTGHLPVAHTLETMDQCRVSWGKVIGKLSFNKNLSNLSNWSNLIVETKSLEYVGDRLRLGPARPREVKSFFVRPQVGDWVSVHWGIACEVLGRSQVLQLAQYTKLALRHINMLIR